MVTGLFGVMNLALVAALVLMAVFAFLDSERVASGTRWTLRVILSGWAMGALAIGLSLWLEWRDESPVAVTGDDSLGRSLSSMLLSLVGGLMIGLAVLVVAIEGQRLRSWHRRGGHGDAGGGGLAQSRTLVARAIEAVQAVFGWRVMVMLLWAVGAAYLSHSRLPNYVPDPSAEWYIVHPGTSPPPPGFVAVEEPIDPTTDQGAFWAKWSSENPDISRSDGLSMWRQEAERSLKKYGEGDAARAAATEAFERRVAELRSHRLWDRAAQTSPRHSVWFILFAPALVAVPGGVVIAMAIQLLCLRLLRVVTEPSDADRARLWGRTVAAGGACLLVAGAALAIAWLTRPNDELAAYPALSERVLMAIQSPPEKGKRDLFAEAANEIVHRPGCDLATQRYLVIHAGDLPTSTRELRYCQHCFVAQRVEWPGVRASMLGTSAGGFILCLVGLVMSSLRGRCRHCGSRRAGKFCSACGAAAAGPPSPAEPQRLDSRPAGSPPRPVIVKVARTHTART